MWTTRGYGLEPMRQQALLVTVLAALALSCGGPSGGPPATAGGSKPAPGKPKVSGPPALESVEVARVPAGTFGPYVGQGRDGALLVWAPSNGDKRSWFTLPVAPDGTPDGAPRTLPCRVAAPIRQARAATHA